jgi:signal transduction histidine kinase
VNLEAVLSQAVADLQAPIAETAAAITHGPLPTVPGHECQLRRVLQNLIGNALKYSGGRPPEVHVAAQREDGHWLLSVCDRGVGIPPEQHERIFQIFQRGQASDAVPGKGIGLAVCRRLVERHGGRIWVESQPKSGSTFYFTLPAV